MGNPYHDAKSGEFTSKQAGVSTSAGSSSGTATPSTVNRHKSTPPADLESAETMGSHAWFKAMKAKTIARNAKIDAAGRALSKARRHLSAGLAGATVEGHNRALARYSAAVKSK